MNWYKRTECLLKRERSEPYIILYVYFLQSAVKAKNRLLYFYIKKWRRRGESSDYNSSHEQPEHMLLPSPPLSAIPWAVTGNTEPVGSELWVSESNRFLLICLLSVAILITGSVGHNAGYESLNSDTRG
jgi:hypothetical protein